MDAALVACANAIRGKQRELQAANEKDLARSDRFHLTDAMADRLRLTEEVIEGMASSLERIAAQQDPVGRPITAYDRPGGLRIEKRRVPIGVVGIIYESRPNVTADAASLCLKSGNGVILRGGKEAINSNKAIHAQIVKACEQGGLDPRVVQLVTTPDREVVAHLLREALEKEPAETSTGES